MKFYKDKKKEIEITTVDEWLEFCPPVNPKRQWVDKRSAKEMAVFWTNTQKQKEFLLYLNKINREIIFNYALPETSTKFDVYKSPRKNDLCIYAKDRNKNVLISIEGKSDESFGGKKIGKEWIDSIKTKIIKKDSKKIDRLIGLYRRFNCDAGFMELRYQLSYWLAGTIDEAIRNEIDTVFLIVQEFYSDITDNTKIEKNRCDLDFFVNFLSNSFFTEVNSNEIIGPIKNSFTKQINLYVGKYQILL